ncbi:hypothetical protein [Euzebya tangerina]|uniref:hypothetical protein n=1 Tax=Euzebya tangerina TaxID=591198 RepID=UPI000E317AEC|nr:hypothetical protein [Euzebya tangerina]
MRSRRLGAALRAIAYVCSVPVGLVLILWTVSFIVQFGAYAFPRTVHVWLVLLTATILLRASSLARGRARTALRTHAGLELALSVGLLTYAWLFPQPDEHVPGAIMTIVVVTAGIIQLLVAIAPAGSASVRSRENLRHE